MRLSSMLSLLYVGTCGVLISLALLAAAVVNNNSVQAEKAADMTVVDCGTPNPLEDSSLAIGKKLWDANACGSCHSRDMKNDMTGPALGGVTDRWADHPAEDLRSWIRNSQALIQSGHPRANAVWSNWKPTAMPNYNHLTDEEIDQILIYIERE